MPVAAVELIVMLTGTVPVSALYPPLPIVAVTPEPLKVTADAPANFVPLIFAERVVPAAPEFGSIPVIVGGLENAKDVVDKI